MKIRHIFWFTFFVVFFFISARAQAFYVLPYPSYLPGNKLYSVSRVVDVLKKWWHWGSLSSFKYHLQLSDKYLVESKTLFEYTQYPLAIDALRRSNDQFLDAMQSFSEIEKGNIDPKASRFQLIEGAEVHRKVISKLIGELPESFLWTPEKNKPMELSISRLLDEAVKIREQAIKH